MLLNDNLVADHTRLTARLDYITRRSRVRIPPKRTFGLLCSSVGRASNCLIDNFVDRFSQIHERRSSVARSNKTRLTAELEYIDCESKDAGSSPVGLAWPSRSSIGRAYL